MDSFSYQDYILPYSTLKTSSQPFGHGIPEFSLTISGKTSVIFIGNLMLLYIVELLLMFIELKCQINFYRIEYLMFPYPVVIVVNKINIIVFYWKNDHYRFLLTRIKEFFC